MKVWDVAELAVRDGHPEVLVTGPAGRAIAIHLHQGHGLGEHQVYESAWLVVARGQVRVTDADGVTRDLQPGSLATFDPSERHEVLAVTDAMLLLLLTPWPAPERNLEEIA